MSGGVDDDPDLLLGLVLRQAPTEAQRGRDRRLEIAHLDVEVDLHLLLALERRPLRLDVVALQLEAQVDMGPLRRDRRPVLLVALDRPAEDLGVEAGETPRVRRTDHGAEVVVGCATSWKHAFHHCLKSGPRANRA